MHKKRDGGAEQSPVALIASCIGQQTFPCALTGAPDLISLPQEVQMSSW